jgi:hypothetical protein
LLCLCLCFPRSLRASHAAGLLGRVWLGAGQGNGRPTCRRQCSCTFEISPPPCCPAALLSARAASMVVGRMGAGQRESGAASLHRPTGAGAMLMVCSRLGRFRSLPTRRRTTTDGGQPPSLRQRHA